ncbi:iron ABC transporter permease [Ktedonosporobacter rubrisoli]|uniref:Iron ABC transporter permease n=1 Tax=Ktedonosporobacter rubrisoli TaxID=2509675 RepID=A0A4P6K3D7_KTERU|nr:iron ABC transporter permease [Ktedonosporobacter rubrisoli]QBD82472.1 iron ABC transporter permease [Ktedonosporobacter rubrisoli]
MNVKTTIPLQVSRPGNSVAYRLILFAMVILAGVVLLPLLILIITVVENGSSVIRVLGQPDTLQPLANTVEVTVASTLLAHIIGVASALIVNSIPARWQRWWHLAALLPLFIPPFVGAFSWLQAYARGGLSDYVLHQTFPWLYGPLGVIVLLAVHSAPLTYIILSATLARLDPRPIEAARIHGARRWEAFVSVVWPALRPALIAATGLVFALNAGDFGIPLVLGIPAHFLTATTQIYQELSFTSTPDSFSIAMALSLVLALGSLLVLLALQRFESGHSLITYAALPQARQRKEGQVLRGIGQVALLVYTLVVTIIPFIALVLTSLTTSYGLAPLPQNLTLAHIVDTLQESTATAIVHSLLLAALAALVIVAVGLSGAEWSHKSRWGRILTRLAWLPYAIPGSVIGVATTIAYGKWLYGTFAIIFLAYLAKFWGLAEPIAATRTQIEASRVRAGRLFGARPFQAYLVGIWPQLGGTALACGVLVFINSIYELTMSSLLYAPGTETLAIAVLNAEEGGDAATTATIGVLLTLLMVVSLLVLTAGRQSRKLEEKKSI